ncbi:MAG: HNH endonuclease [Clostridia bacterium]|nr:HNH endonuclease [Clostridia bacterium]
MIKKYPDKVFVIIDSERFREWEVEQAINMFNSLNADGLPLCDSDIISAQLYSAAKKQNKDEEYNKLWNELKIKINDLESKKILNIDSLLMQQMYYERAYKKEILTDSKTINVTPPGLRRYFIDINRDFANNPIESCTRMLKLAKMWLKIIEYPIVQVLFKFNENFKLFLAAYLLRFEIEELSEEKIYKVVKCFLRLFSIMELVDTGYSSSKFKTFLFKEQLKLIDSNVTEEEIENDFDEHIFKEWDKDELKKDIIEYEKNILIYLNEYLFAKEAQIKFDIDTKYDIEHIMPNSGNNLQIIRTDAGISDKNEFDKFVNKLGNKILLEYRINRSIGNEWFRTKVSTKITDKTGYKDSEFPIAQALVVKYQENYEKKYWTKDDIKIATEKAAERIVNFIFYNK